ncbi:MAG TPA: hypothetical protein VKZ41_10015 [Gemmatimonadales bacterium]|nr:hypothetical protein [Gemmatimonadales bacterium]
MLPQAFVALIAIYFVVGYLVLFTLYELRLVRVRPTRHAGRFVLAVLLWPLTVVYLLVDRVTGGVRAGRW